MRKVGELKDLQDPKKRKILEWESLPWHKERGCPFWDTLMVFDSGLTL